MPHDWPTLQMVKLEERGLPTATPREDRKAGIQNVALLSFLKARDRPPETGRSRGSSMTNLGLVVLFNISISQ